MAKNDKTGKVVISNITVEQARQFASWYWEQGEQDADVWFEINEVPTPMVTRTFEQGDEVHIVCKSFE